MVHVFISDGNGRELGSVSINVVSEHKLHYHWHDTPAGIEKGDLCVFGTLGNIRDKVIQALEQETYIRRVKEGFRLLHSDAWADAILANMPVF